MWVGADRLFADSLDRYLAAVCWKLRLLERRERDLIARVVRPGMIAVDVGANLGLHTLGLARAVGPSGRVHALEPEPRNCTLLSRAVREAGLAQVCVHRMAAAEAPDTLTLHLSPVNRGDHRVVADDGPRRALTVSAVALDALLAGEPRIDFVKIDVQGAEVAVLRGLRETLQRCPALTMLCELSPDLLRRAGVGAAEFFAPPRAAGLVPHRLGRHGMPEPIDETAAWALAERQNYVNLYFQRA